MWLNHKCFPPSADSRTRTAHRARATLARPRRSTLRAPPACQLSENKEPTHERLGNHLQQGRSHRAPSPAVPHKPSPEEVAEHLLEWAEANLKPGHYSTGKLESDEPAELLLRRFGIVVTGIAEA